MKINKRLNVKGLACPMPVVKTKKAMETLNTGEILEVLVTDKGAISDFPAWAKASQHEILSLDESEDEIKFLIKKG